MSTMNVMCWKRVAEELDMCLVHKAQDYDTALQYLLSYTYDIVILDIIGGVNGLRTSQKWGDVRKVGEDLSKRSPGERRRREKLYQAGGRLINALKKKLPEACNLSGGCCSGAKESPSGRNSLNGSAPISTYGFGPDWKERDPVLQGVRGRDEEVRLGLIGDPCRYLGVGSGIMKTWLSR